MQVIDASSHTKFGSLNIDVPCYEIKFDDGEYLFGGDYGQANLYMIKGGNGWIIRGDFAISNTDIHLLKEVINKAVQIIQEHEGK